MDYLVKALIEKDEEKGGYVAIASTAVEDRQGEVVEVEGWDLKNFKANPVLLLFHDHHSLPVGKAERIWIDKSGKSKLMFKPVFEEITERGRAISELVKQGFLSAFSVGFRPVDTDGNKYTKQELLEISLVNVPANPEAMMLSYKALKQADISEKTIKEVVPSKDLEVQLLKEEVSSLKEQVETAVNGLKHLNPHIGRNQRIVKERLSMNKVIAKSIDLIAKGEQPETEKLNKIIKRANEILIVSQKGEINGQN